MALSEPDMAALGMAAKGHRMTMRENLLKLQKLAHLYNEPRAGPRSVEMKLRSYYSEMRIIEEVDEDGTSMTNRSHYANSMRLSWHSIRRDITRKNRSAPRSTQRQAPCITIRNELEYLRRTKSRAASAIETEIVRDYGPIKAIDDSRRGHLRVPVFEIEEIDQFAPETSHAERVSHMAQQSDGNLEEQSPVSSPDFSNESTSNQETELCPFYIGLEHLRFMEPISSKKNVFKGFAMGKSVIIKSIPRTDSDSNSQTFRRAMKESALLHELRHPNIVQFIGQVIEPDSILFVTEFLARRTLFDALHSEHSLLSDRIAFKMLEEVLCALSFLHSRGLLHGNLKSKSIFVSEDWTFKLANFGSLRLKRLLHKLATQKSITGDLPYWLPPETFTHGVFDTKSDVYSFGILLWEVAEGRTPLVGLSFDELSSRACAGLITTGLLTSIGSAFKPLVPMIEKCLHPDPTCRPLLPELLREVRKIRHDVQTKKQVNSMKAIVTPAILVNLVTSSHRFAMVHQGN